MKIHPVGGGVPCGRTDGRTEMTKLVVVLHNFLNVHKNRCLFSDPHKTPKYTVGRTWNFWLLNLVVHVVTIGLWRINAYHLVWKTSNYGDVWKGFTGGSSALRTLNVPCWEPFLGTNWHSHTKCVNFIVTLYQVLELCSVSSRFT
jgi:hypothetical protein